MKKILVSIVLVFTLSAITSYFGANPTVSVVEAKQKKKKAYAMTWKGYKKRWKKQAKEIGFDNVAKIKNYEIRKTNYGPAHYGYVKEDMYVGLNSNRDNDGEFGAINFSGRVTPDVKNSGINASKAAAVLVLTADPSLSFEKRKTIALDKLHVNSTYKGPITFKYSKNGVSYVAEHKIGSNGVGTLKVTIKQE